MKKILFLFASTIVLASCGSGTSTEQKGNTTVSGELTGSAGENLVLVDVNQKDFKVLDSVHVDKDGKFQLAANISEVGVYNVEVSSSNFITLILAPGDKAVIKGDLKNLGATYTVEGSEESKHFYAVNDFSKKNGYKKAALKAKMDSLQNYFQFLISKRNDQKYIDSLNKGLEPTYNELSMQMEELMQSGVDFGKKFIDDNPKVFATIIALNLLDPQKNFDYYIKVDESLAQAYPNSNNLKPFHSWVADNKDQYTKLAVGSPAPDFTVKDPSGKDISLASLKGKVLLVDFWASWCGPCRKENPNVVMAYSKYKAKGLEILGVSLDDDKGKWLDAIKKDGLGWLHGSELKGWQSSFVTLYGFTGIPFNVLLDKDGKILGKNLRGPQLEKALEDAFAKG
jgi:thiol-disulfide isomerase/thioredoxin